MALEARVEGAMKFFHVTNEAYSVGDHIGPYPNPRAPDDENRASIDEFLDARKPDAAPSRSRAVFAFKSAAEAAHYGAAQRLSRLYEVTFPSPPCPAPIVLIGRLESIGTSSQSADALADEYWNPTSGWEVLEQLGWECEVVDVVQSPDAIAIAAAQFAYENDRTRACEDFPA